MKFWNVECWHVVLWFILWCCVFFCFDILYFENLKIWNVDLFSSFFVWKHAWTIEFYNLKIRNFKILKFWNVEMLEFIYTSGFINISFWNFDRLISEMTSLKRSLRVLCVYVCCSHVSTRTTHVTSNNTRKLRFKDVIHRHMPQFMLSDTAANISMDTWQIRFAFKAFSNMFLENYSLNAPQDVGGRDFYVESSLHKKTFPELGSRWSSALDLGKWVQVGSICATLEHI